MTAPAEAPVTTEAPLSAEEIRAFMGEEFDFDSEPACEGRGLPVCTICGMNCKGCNAPAEFVARNDCGCLYLMCSGCRTRVGRHFAAHPGFDAYWSCLKCGVMVTGLMSRWTPL